MPFLIILQSIHHYILATEAHTVATHQEGAVVSNTAVLLHLQQMMLILLEMCLVPSRVGVGPR